MGRRKNYMVLFFGVTLVVAGTVTACSIDKDIDADTQVQIEVNQNEQDYVKQQEQYQKEINTELQNIKQEEQKNNIQEIETEQLKHELDHFWSTYNEVLTPFIERGLTVEEFNEIYKLVRVGNEDVISANDAYQMTYKELERRYKIDGLMDDIGFEGNITISENGEYIYSKEFLDKLRKRPYFEGATDKEIKVFMNDFMEFFAGHEEELDTMTMNSLLETFDESGNLHKENITIAESESGKTQPSNPNKNTGSTSNNNTGDSNNNQSAPQEQGGSSEYWDGQSSGNNPAFNGATIGGSFGGGTQVVPDGFTVH